METCKRKMLFERMKRASSKFHAKKREVIKSRWYHWVDGITGRRQAMASSYIHNRS